VFVFPFQRPVSNEYIPSRESFDALKGKSGNFRSRDGMPFPVDVSDAAMRDDGEQASEWYNDDRRVSLGTDVGVMDDRELSEFRGTIGEIYIDSLCSRRCISFITVHLMHYTITALLPS
jgi:hypothetical protein